MAISKSTIDDNTPKPTTCSYISRFLNNVQKSDLPLPEEDLAKWEAEFSQLMNAQRDELDYGASMQEAWESGIGDFSEGPSTDKALRFDPEGVPILGDYVFGTISSPPLSLVSLTTDHFSNRTNQPLHGLPLASTP